MKSFKDFLVERTPAQTMDGKQTFEFIKEHCAKYLQENKDLDRNIMWRGMTFRSEGAVVKNVRKDRKPMSTGGGVHKVLDKWFHDKFGMYARSQGLFTTGDIRQAGTYGERFVIFPVGDYKYVWSPMVRDLYAIRWEDEKEAAETAEKLKNADPKDPFPLKPHHFNELPSLNPEQEARVRGIMDRLQYQDDGINEALKTKHEVVVMCDQYVAVPIHLWDNDLRYRIEYM